jgi:hypothetical protein
VQEALEVGCDCGWERQGTQQVNMTAEFREILLEVGDGNGQGNRVLHSEHVSEAWKVGSARATWEDYRVRTRNEEDSLNNFFIAFHFWRKSSMLLR